MKNINRRSTVFLQAVVVLIGILALAIMIRFPMTEGRAKNLDLLSIYLDPFILYAYAASTAFFVALYKVFRLLGFIGQNKAFSQNSVQALKSIKYCAIILGALIMLAGLFVVIFHHKDDDPAGFIAICIATTFITIVVAITASVLEAIFQNGLNIQPDNEQLHALSGK
ncbi:MAG TPA: DUF2975 domain-containing protein [Phnomibacter sp.]|nr:DUF2975 domain-containing protein [Phnomibacter sp.]